MSDDELDIQLLQRINKADFLEAVRKGVIGAIPPLNRDRLYEVIGEAVKEGVKEYLKGKYK